MAYSQALVLAGGVAHVPILITALKFLDSKSLKLHNSKEATKAKDKAAAMAAAKLKAEADQAAAEKKAAERKAARARRAEARKAAAEKKAAAKKPAAKKAVVWEAAAPWLHATQLLPPGFVYSSVLHLSYRVLLLRDTKGAE